MLNYSCVPRIVRAMASPGPSPMRIAAATARRAPISLRTSDDDLKRLAKQAAEAARLLKLMGNEKRLLILCFLAARGEMTVGEIVGVVKLSQSALSQHLGKLRTDGLVTFRRDSQTLYYRVADPRALRLLKLLKDIYCSDLG
jgi:DNA-binding transcriptional ArsR family regulator